MRLPMRQLSTRDQKNLLKVTLQPSTISSKRAYFKVGHNVNQSKRSLQKLGKTNKYGRQQHTKAILNQKFLILDRQKNNEAKGLTMFVSTQSSL